MGFVIDSPVLAVQIGKGFEAEVPDRAYRVRLTSDGDLEWVERVDGKEVIHQDEPGTTVMKRVGISVLSWLPIEWLL